MAPNCSRTNRAADRRTRAVVRHSLLTADTSSHSTPSSDCAERSWDDPHLCIGSHRRACQQLPIYSSRGIVGPRFGVRRRDRSEPSHLYVSHLQLTQEPSRLALGSTFDRTPPTKL